MTTEAYRRRNFFYWFKTAHYGATAGLIAGVPLSMLIVLAQILPVIGGYLRIEGPWASFFIHFSLSAIFGAVFAILAVRYHLAVKLHFKFRKTLPVGLAFGILLWSANFLILFPLLFPANVKIIENLQLIEILLAGHLFYGVMSAMLFTIFYWKSPRIWMRPLGAFDWNDYLKRDDEGNKTIGVLPTQKK